MRGMRGSAFGLALVFVAAASAGCFRENEGERLTRECREAVNAAVDADTTTNPAVATVKRTDMEDVIRSEHWATTPLRKEIRAGLGELETSRGYTSDQYEAAWDKLVDRGGERDGIWRAAFERDLPRRERIRDKMVSECVSKRGTKERGR
jgi:hypothetical protein